MITHFEALERIIYIWGAGHWDIHPQGNGTTYVSKEDAFHVLDGNGHPTCHQECKDSEALAYERKLLK